MRVKPLTATEKRSRPKKQNHAIKRITPQEEEFIAANWETMTPNEIARAIGRHRESVRYVARRLGLTPIGRPCKPGYLTPLARIRYTTGDIKGDLADVPVDDLRLLRERGQRAQKGEREQ